MDEVFQASTLSSPYDAVRVQKLLLAGITATPPNPRIAKTALGAEETVPSETVTA